MTSVAGAKAHHVLTRDAALKGQLFHRRGERSSCEAKGRPSWEACSLAGRHGVESEVPRQLESMAEVVPRVLQHCGRVGLKLPSCARLDGRGRPSLRVHGSGWRPALTLALSSSTLRMSTWNCRAALGWTYVFTGRSRPVRTLASQRVRTKKCIGPSLRSG
jgi:hypothetical protein